MAKTIKVYWKPEEKQQFLNNALHLGGRPANGDSLRIYELAMRQMPAGRRRAYDPSLAAQMNKFRKSAGTTGTATVPGPEPKLAVIADVGVAPQPEPEPEVEELPEIPMTAAERCSEFGVTVLVGIFSDDRVRESLRGLVNIVHSREPVTFQPTQLFKEVHNHEPKKKRVVIAGLKGHQLTEIDNAQGKRLDLRFWQVHESPDLLKQLSKQADVVVGFTNFLAHSHETMIRGNTKNYVRLSGGLTRLKTLLEGV